MYTTTIAGSLLKPGWLAEPEKLWALWRLEGEDLNFGMATLPRDLALIELQALGVGALLAAKG